MNLCEKCIADKSLCIKCWQNPIYKDLRNYFKEYEPVCPIGRTDCVCDPAYIKYHHPKWYKELYGDKTPQEVALTCQDRDKNDDEDTCWNYDDEDK